MPARTSISSVSRGTGSFFYVRTLLRAKIVFSVSFISASSAAPAGPEMQAIMVQATNSLIRCLILSVPPFLRPGAAHVPGETNSGFNLHHFARQTKIEERVPGLCAQFPRNSADLWMEKKSSAPISGVRGAKMHNASGLLMNIRHRFRVPSTGEGAA